MEIVDSDDVQITPTKTVHKLDLNIIRCHIKEINAFKIISLIKIHITIEKDEIDF